MENNLRSIRLITFFALLAVAAAFLFPLVEWTTTIALGGALLVLTAAALLTWAIENWLRFLLNRLGEKHSNSGAQPDQAISAELNLLLSGSRRLLSARSRREVVEIVLQTGSSILKADGASFLSFEEWGAPMQPITYGEVPQARDGKWLERLKSPALRQVCRSCGLLESGTECALCLDTDMQPSRVICRPLTDGSREMGLINFFFNSPLSPTAVNRQLFQDLAENASIVLKAVRNREQETIAYRNMQLPSTGIIPKDYFSDLCTGIRHALDIESVLFWLVEDSANSSGTTKIYIDNENAMEKEYWNAETLQALWSTALGSSNCFEYEVNPHGKYGKKKFLVVYQVVGQVEKPTGLLILADQQPIQVNDQQSALLQVVARESSVLITAEKTTEMLEFKAVGDERIRLAREIHDGLAQTLAYLKFQSAQMLTILSSGNVDRLESALSANYQTLSEAYQDARLAIDNLRSIPEGDTQNWLLKQATNFTDATGIPVDATRLHIQADIPLPTQAQLIRIVQEALNNVRKHAQAHRVVVRGSVRDDEINIEIADDGRGFEPDQVAFGSKFGLVGMRERTELIGGDFQIISKPGEGTIVRLAVPIKVRIS
jgi:two-component system, NarL family, nitrate/nitrite sensor histidine kinase NarX